ncbi:MAG: hypothetical protein D6809_06665, partial [Gammaproteobacteria bacterium]
MAKERAEGEGPPAGQAPGDQGRPRRRGRLRRLLAFLLEVGLAAAATAFVLLVVLRPELLRPPPPVQILQA